MLVSTNMKTKGTLFQTVTEKSCVSLMYNIVSSRDTDSSNSEHLASSRREFTWKSFFCINLPGFENRNHQVPPQKLCPAGTPFLMWLRFLTVQGCRMHTGQELLRAGRAWGSAIKPHRSLQHFRSQTSNVSCPPPLPFSSSPLEIQAQARRAQKVLPVLSCIFRGTGGQMLFLGNFNILIFGFHT